MRGDNYDDVGEFHRKFGLTAWGKGDGRPSEITEEAIMFRVRFLLEELEELCEGYGIVLDWELMPTFDIPPNLPKIADALIDLVYVAMGTAHLHRLPWQDLWREVQRANMTKERAKADGSNSVRNSALDVVKPEGWRPPNIIDTLMVAGWPGPPLPNLEKE